MSNREAYLKGSLEVGCGKLVFLLPEVNLPYAIPASIRLIKPTPCNLVAAASQCRRHASTDSVQATSSSCRLQIEQDSGLQPAALTL